MPSPDVQMKESVLNHLRETACGRLPLLATVLMALLFISTPLYALGLGTLTLNSHLNEKLDATVPLLLSGSETMKKVNVQLASPAEYRQMGLPWNGFLKLVRVEIHNRMSGAPYVKLVSPLLVDAPLLSLVLKATKEGRGTYFRHYQVFLDPTDMPALYDREPQVMAISQDADAPSENFDGSQGWSRIWRYGPVKAGDSLSEVAYRLRKDKRFSNRQVMLALYEGNPGSFANGDINHLKKGAWLEVPKGEVVTSYASVASMQKLSRLLATSTTSGTAAKAEAKAVVNATANGTVKTESEELQYSGNITLNKASGSADPISAERVDMASLQKLDSIHEEVMSGKLQMADLGSTVANLGKSVSGIQQEMKALKADVKLLKAKTEASSSSQEFNYWMAGFFVLLTVLGVVVIVMLSRRNVKGEWEQRDDAVKPITSSAVAKQQEHAPETKPEAEFEVKPVVAPEVKPEIEFEKPEPTALKEPATAVEPVMQSAAAQQVSLENETLANKIEESLGSCDYEKAEQMLEAAERQSPDSLRLAALKAQLYHETDRDELRNALINTVSESSDKQRWEEFCKVLPAHVWNACFGDGDGGQ